tara:strand:+ start:1428 stop:1877 length:450 start_codon:yes stop_codon:yes gene_type:complete
MGKIVKSLVAVNPKGDVPSGVVAPAVICFVIHGFLTFYDFKYVDFLADVKLFFDKKIGVIGKANPTPPSFDAGVNPLRANWNHEKSFLPLSANCLVTLKYHFPELPMLAHSVFTFATYSAHFNHAAARLWWCGDAKYVAHFSILSFPLV